MVDCHVWLRRLVARPFRKFTSTLVIAAFVGAPLACGDDDASAPESSTNAGLPEAGTQQDAGRRRDAGSAVEVSSDTATSPVVDAASTRPHDESSRDVTTDVTDVDAGEVPSSACRPSQCTCPEPGSKDCCPEHIPYRRITWLTAEEEELLGGGTTTPPDEQPVETTYNRTRSQLWSSFATQCGAAPCHGLPAKEFTFYLNEETFDDGLFDASHALRLINGEQEPVMPIGSTLEQAKQRDCTNPLVKLGRELVAWQASGFADDFVVELCPEEIEEPAPGPEPGVDPAAACGSRPIPFAVLPEIAQGQTNIGQCIPTQAASSCPEYTLRAKDELFSALQRSEDLPEKLSETDLISLDSEILAMNKVYSYAPTYTLFSDNAKKQRYVRVPLGKKLVYNDETQDFDIPENTRFYKTFLRQVVEEDGTVSYRKMETRLIVVRPDQELGDGKFQFQALRATYAWTNDEREAYRVKDPKNNGEEWVDRVCPVVVNETVTRDPELNPILDVVPDGCDYMTESELEDPESGRVRHYGIPGEDRCDQCHLGSNNHSYILGFNPWQVDRRKAGEGGVYDPVHDDELDQLARFISYGLIEGVEPGEARLETSQGDRAPRNDYELTAQAYMIGNCAYCHSPHGFPTAENPLLRPLNMFPSRDGGGIFQFPLDMVSPRIAGNPPYITTTVFEDQSNIESRMEGVYKPFDGVAALVPDYNRGSDYVPNVGVIAYAPWQSAIWRNVYTPFTYADDNAIFVHMPRHVAGFDCRAHEIMAAWMLGIPTDLTSPYVEEVPNDDPGYRLAKIGADRRVSDYKNSLTGQHCPTDDDIVDPAVLRSPIGSDGSRQVRAPLDNGTLNSSRIVPVQGEPANLFVDGVPDHVHWVSADFSSAGGAWAPRNLAWKRLLTGEVPAPANMAALVADLSEVHVSEERVAFSLDPVPLGTWAQSCDAFAEARGARRANAFTEARDTNNRWIADGPFSSRGVPADAFIHEVSRGQAVVEAVCQNCHGVNFDSRSPLAATIAELSGGETRVADLRNGLFGPVDAPGAYADAVFTFSEGNDGAAARDWAARYLLFMGSGGTLAKIPEVALNMVATSPFYEGTMRNANDLGSANMLATVPCDKLLRTRLAVEQRAGGGFVLLPDTKTSDFVLDTGHFQLWESICGYQQQPIVRIMGVNEGFKLFSTGLLYYSRDRNGNATYPEGAWVGDQLGRVVPGIDASNTTPWCVLDNTEVSNWLETASIDASEVPFCPPELFASAFEEAQTSTSDPAAYHLHRMTIQGEPGILEDPERKEQWVRKGRFNAGLAAFIYFEQLAKGAVTPVPRFNSPECTR